jgi:uncharacterized Tic20 family protein
MDEMNTEKLEQPIQESQGYSKDERTWAMIAHISAVAGFIFPFGNIIAPLLIWILKKDELPFVGDQGKEALNFQISVTIYILISVLLILVVIGIALLIVLGIFALIMTIIAAINAYDGNAYRYPLTIRLVK